MVGMNDPLPENIAGEKRVTHSVEHSINWGHVALGVAVLALVLYLNSLGSRRSSEETEDGEIGF